MREQPNGEEASRTSGENVEPKSLEVLDEEIKQLEIHVDAFETGSPSLASIKV